MNLNTRGVLWCAALALALALGSSCASESTKPTEEEPTASWTEQAIDNNCFTDPTKCLNVTPNKVTCYKPGTATDVANGYSYSDSAGTDGANGFSGTNWGRTIVDLPTNQNAPLFSSLTSAQQRDILRFMNNLAMSNWGGVPSTTSILNHSPVAYAWGGYSKAYSVDTAFRLDYLIYWNAAENCAYILTNLPAWQGAVANMFTRYSTVTGPDGYAYDHGPLGLPTSNFFGDAWGNSWQRFTHGYITSRSTGYGDMTNRAYYVGGPSLEDRALAAEYGKLFDYPGNSANNYPLTQDPQCSSSLLGPSCILGTTGRFTKAIGPFSYVQTVLARTGESVAYKVAGEIGNRWRTLYGSSQPWNGALGHPKSDEFVNAGVTQQNFERGYMTWNGSVATAYTPSLCSDVCPTSPSTTSCWETMTGTQQTCGSVTCSSLCSWGSEPGQYCYDGTEGNTNSTCGTYGIDRTDADCLRNPLHAGCLPLNQANYATYGVCNDGTVTPIVPNVATRAWSSLTTSERSNINTLMNNAAALVGCTSSPDYWAVADFSLDPNSLDLSKAAYTKSYNNQQLPGAPMDTNCGTVYFNRALGCAFPVAKTDTPVGSASVATRGVINIKWSANNAGLGLPTSLPQRAPADPKVAWQRFANGYVTHRRPDANAYFIGGTTFSDDGAALASRYGRDFDYYLSTTPTLTLTPLPLHIDTLCMNAVAPYYAGCGTSSSGLVGQTVNAPDGKPVTFWQPRGAKAGIETKGVVGMKFLMLATWQVGAPVGDFSVLPTSAPPTDPSLMVGWPTTEERPVKSTNITEQTFTGGKIYAQGPNAKFVLGYMEQRYEAFGGAIGLGFPLEDSPDPAGGNIERKQRFTFGDLTTNPLAQLDSQPDPEPEPTRPLFVWAVPDKNVGDTGVPIHLSWHNDSFTTQNVIYEQVDGDGAPGSMLYPWVAVATLDNPPVGPAGRVSYDRTPVSWHAGMKLCYRIKANPSGLLSEVVCTHAGDGRDIEVQRAEVRIKVANVNDGDTDDWVKVSLRQGNTTWIDSPIDDFERGSTTYYFLMPDGIKRTSDITRLAVYVPGSDAVCIESIALYINHARGTPTDCSNPASNCAFEKVYGSTSQTCKWIEDSPGNGLGRFLFVDHEELRQGPQWLNYTFRGAPLDQSQVIQTINGVAGHISHERGYEIENDEPTTIQRIANDSGPRSDNHLQATIHGNGPAFFSADVDVDVVLHPQWDCSLPGDNQIARYTASLDFHLHVSLGWATDEYLNLFWSPLLPMAIDWVANQFINDRVVDFPGLGLRSDRNHVCSPLPENDAVTGNGLNLCVNDSLPQDDATWCKTASVLYDGPTASGSITSTPAGISCTGDRCSHNFDNAPCSGFPIECPTITLAANPAPGFVFTGWQWISHNQPNFSDSIDYCIAPHSPMDLTCRVYQDFFKSGESFPRYSNPVVKATFAPAP